MTIQTSCAVLSCFADPSTVVDHPGRPEDGTPMCEEHSQAVCEAFEDAEEVDVNE